VLSPRPSLLAGPSPRLDFKVEKQPVGPLCKCLMVPEGAELVFAIRDLLTRGRQHISFSITDMTGNPMAHIIVNEVGPTGGINMQLLNKTPLASVRTTALHDRRGGMPEICWASGQTFCTLAPCRKGSQKAGVGGGGKPGGGAWGGGGGAVGYELRDLGGQLLYTVHGDFDEKAINIVAPTGQVVCRTERCEVPFDDEPHYQVRVAPCVDAGLMTCALFSIDKLEGMDP